MKKDLLKKVKNYAALSAAALAAGTTANAEVIYNDIADVDLTGNGYSFYDLDLNGDSQTDFRIWRSQSISSNTNGGNWGPYYSGSCVWVGSWNSNSITTRQQVGMYNMGSSNQILGYSYASALSSGNNINGAAGSFGSNRNLGRLRNSQGIWTSYSNSCGSINNNSGSWGPYTNSYGNWTPTTTAYAGVRFYIGSDLHYGWIRMEVSADMNVKIMDLAYESCPNTAISAGATSGGDPDCIVTTSECTNATTITCNSITAGSNIGDTPTGQGTCGTDEGSGGAIWYKMLGNGGDITAETITGNYDTKIWVFSGSDCNSLNCVTGDDDSGGPGNLSLVNFSTTLGETYYIVVGGYSSGEGNYELEVSCTNCASVSTQPDVAGCDSVEYNGTIYFSDMTVSDTIVNGASSGCDSLVVTNIIVSAPSTIVASADQTVCSTVSSVNASAISFTNLGGGYWGTTGTGTFLDSTQASITYYPSAQDKANGSVKLYVVGLAENEPCPNVTDTVVITFQAAPMVTADENMQLCTGTTTANLNAMFSNASGIIWSTSGNGNYNDNTSATPVYTFGGADGSGVTLTVTTTGNGVCSAATDQVNITFGSQALLTYNITACDGSEVYGIFRDSSGVFMDTITGGSCDTIITTNLTVQGYTQTTSRNVTIDQGDSIMVGGAYQNTAGTYRDTLMAMSGCDSIIVTNLTVNTGGGGNVAENLKQLAKIYPNPSSGMYNLDLTALIAEKADFILTDKVGRVIRHELKVPTKEVQLLDLTEVEDGIYFLTIRTENGSNTFKLVKTK